MGASSSKVAMTDTSRRTTLLRGLVSTAVEMKYPMWLVPVSAFVKLTKLEPHQVMRHRGELVRWEPSMQTVFFLSHQWTSFEHPDHTMDQVRCFKRLLIRMMKGEVATTVPDFAAQSTTIPSNHAPAFTDLHHVGNGCFRASHRLSLTLYRHPPHTNKQRMYSSSVTCTAVYLPKGLKVTTKEWQAMVSDAYIWMDYMSVPQIGTYLDAGVSDLMKAVESIPAYGELSVNQRYRTDRPPVP